MASRITSRKYRVMNKDDSGLFPLGRKIVAKIALAILGEAGVPRDLFGDLAYRSGWLKRPWRSAASGWRASG